MTVDLTYDNANAKFEKDLLKVSNSHIERCWQWAGTGFVTTSLVTKDTGTIWTRDDASVESDWLPPGYDGPQSG